MNPVRQAIRLAMQAVVPHRLLLIRGPRRAGHDGTAAGAADGVGLLPEIALTFDDGPHPEHTPRILDELARLEMKATFFVIGFDATRHPELIRRMVREGHVVGNHTWMHTEPKETGTSEFLEEISRTRCLLEDLTGVDCRLVRPPKGKLTPAKLVGLWGQGQTTVLWNVDPKDYLMQSAQQITGWAESLRCRQGDVILLHDSRPWAISSLAPVAESGVRTVTISDWLSGKPAGRRSADHGGGEQHSDEETLPDTIRLPDQEAGRGLVEEVVSRFRQTEPDWQPRGGSEELTTLPMKQNWQAGR